MSNIAPRYINRYTTADSSARAGDATVETQNWHESSEANWFSGAYSYGGSKRGNNGAFLFGYGYTEDFSYFACEGIVNGEGV